MLSQTVCDNILAMAENASVKLTAKILVVEDDKGISSMLEKVLVEEGHQVYVADNGKTAVSLLAEISPDLVLLDIQVPERSGIELLSDIRKKDREFGFFVPVIMLTGVYTSREDKVKSLNSGVDDFLHKPFDLLELLARVRSLIRVRDLYKRSQYLATHDHLTRCYNRRYLMDFLDREYERTKRYKKPLSYMMLDLDHFKEINDELGHEAGDEVLTYVGFRLQDFFRAVDCVARLGGDEFAAVLPDCGPTEAKKLGERLIAALKTPRETDYLSPRLVSRLGFSVGLACLPAHTNNKEELIRLADEAMYAAKKSGTNQFHLADKKG